MLLEVILSSFLDGTDYDVLSRELMAGLIEPSLRVKTKGNKIRNTMFNDVF